MPYFRFASLLLSFTVFFSACASSLDDTSNIEDTSEDDLTSERDSDSLLAHIVFAGDLGNDAGCADHGTEDACDLFEAIVDLNSGEVESVDQITDTSVSESYPAWHPTEELAYYTIFKTAKEKDLGYVDLENGELGVLIPGATWSEVSPDGSMFLYVLNKTKKIMQASLSADGLSLGTATELTGVEDQQDPAFSSDGSFVVFHDTSAGEGEGAVYDPETEETVFYDSRSGHCTFGALSFITLCDNVSGGGLFSRVYEGGLFGEMELFVEDQKPSVLDDYDPSLAVCQGTSFNYPTFCVDDEHLLVSTSCNENGSVTFSRLFIIDLTESEPIYYPLGKNLQEAFNGPGQSTWTVDCLPD